MVRRLLATGILTLVVGQFALLADAPVALEALLALPPSPGVELLLWPHAGDARVQQRWRAALADEDADRRAAAARMIGIAGLRTALGGLTTALAKEQDAVARAELLRALIVVGSETTDRMVLQRIDRLPPLAARRTIRTVATLRPAGAATFVLEGGVLATLRPMASERAGDLYARLLRVSPSDAARLESAPERLDPGTLQGMLHMAHVTARRVPVSLLMAGLRTDAQTAGEVLSYLPAFHGEPASVDRELAQAYAAWRTQQTSTGDALHDLLLAMADRWLGRDTPAPADIDRVDAQALVRLQLPMSTFAVLSQEERRALTRRLEWKDDEADRLHDARFVDRAPSSDWEDRRPAAVLFTDLPAAALADLVALTECRVRTTADDRALATTYRLDGRPLSILVDGTTAETKCDRLMQAVVRTSYGEPTLPGEEARHALLRVLPEFLSCQRDRDDEWRAPRPVSSFGRSITPPRKTKNQKPIYPAAALDARIHGTVVVEAWLTRTGCVAEGRVTRSVPGLDLAALQAVASWRYTPAQLGDEPVATIMTVTVNFTLDR